MQPQVEKELSNRFFTYTGEEVAKMEPLTFDQVFPALPPVGHEGSIPILEWTKGRTRTFLNRPSDCVASDCGQKLPKLQAKVRIVETDRMKVAALLVSRIFALGLNWTRFSNTGVLQFSMACLVWPNRQLWMIRDLTCGSS